MLQMMGTIRIRTKTKINRNMQTMIKMIGMKRKTIKTKRKNLRSWGQEFKSLGTKGR